ncbi:hypothetical protein [Nakamurella sp.]|uniref:hypothetical protein n=1 Tax=Nakamurella sp. TaxID=1869182 RepID=UPI003B3A2C7C
MSTPTTGPGRVTARPALRVALIGIEVFVAVGAVYGGVGLIADNAIGMLPEWLARTPFATWLWPGILLLLIVALPMATAASAEIARRSWAFAASALAGSAQIGWIVAQWLIVQRYFVLQPIMLACGIAVLILAGVVHGRVLGFARS